MSQRYTSLTPEQLRADNMYAELMAPVNPAHLLPSKRKIIERKLGYVYDPSQLALSYSRRQTLNRCARLFQLRELQQRKSKNASIDTAFGSAFGAGVQELFRSESLERATIAAFAAWDYPEFEDLYGKKKDKSLATCLETVDSFYHNIFPAICAEYKLADLGGRPGIELFVYIQLAESYNYQIHVDLILQNRFSGALGVVEIKTSGKTAMESDWGNSSQTLGYYAVLDTLARKLNLPLEPFVYYICCEAGEMHNPSKNYGFQIFPYVKTPNTTMDFIQEIMHDVRRIHDCIEHDYFPKNGSACTSYNRPCEFYGMCDMNSVQDNAGSVYESLTLADCDFVLSLEDILSTAEQHLLENPNG